MAPASSGWVGGATPGFLQVLIPGEIKSHFLQVCMAKRFGADFWANAHSGEVSGVLKGFNVREGKADSSGRSAKTASLRNDRGRATSRFLAESRMTPLEHRVSDIFENCRPGGSGRQSLGELCNLCWRSREGRVNQKARHFPLNVHSGMVCEAAVLRLTSIYRSAI